MGYIHALEEGGHDERQEGDRAGQQGVEDRRGQEARRMERAKRKRTRKSGHRRLSSFGLAPAAARHARPHWGRGGDMCLRSGDPESEELQIHCCPGRCVATIIYILLLNTAAARPLTSLVLVSAIPSTSIRC